MKFTNRDFALLGMMVAIFAVVLIIIGFTSQVLPATGRILAKSLSGLVLGTIILFTLYKLPKFGVFTLFHIILLSLFALMGMFYLPWFASVLVASILADILANTSKYKSKIKNAIGYGLINMSMQFGRIIVIWFFAEEYVRNWVAKGRSLQAMQESVDVVAGYAGGFILAISFLAGFLGIYIGYKILDKHFTKTKNLTN